MPTDDRIRTRRNFRNPMLLLGGIMTIFYLALGSYILVEKSFLPGIPADFRSTFAVMLLIYGAYRGWRVYADYF